MPETPKKESVKKTDLVKEQITEAESWEADQKHREYYYDDAHGYEVFTDTEEDEPDTKTTVEPGGIDEK